MGIGAAEGTAVARGRGGGGCSVSGPDGAAGRLTFGYALGDAFGAALALGSDVGSADGGTVKGSGSGDWIAGTGACATTAGARERTVFNSLVVFATGGV